jgi:sulfite reductase alpha subunit-like flavoprotein
MCAAFANGRGDADGRAVVKAMKAQRRYVLEVY